jgi:hypothetical protein
MEANRRKEINRARGKSVEEHAGNKLSTNLLSNRGIEGSSDPVEEVEEVRSRVKMPDDKEIAR